MKKFASRIYDYVINPPSDDELKKAWQQCDLQLPVIWMLGKTGAGKSSIVQQLTGHSRAEDRQRLHALYPRFQLF